MYAVPLSRPPLLSRNTAVPLMQLLLVYRYRCRYRQAISFYIIDPSLCSCLLSCRLVFVSYSLLALLSFEFKLTLLDGEIYWCNVAVNQFTNEIWVLSATMLLVSWIFLESSVLLTQVFFKIPFYGILWGCTHVLCGSPTHSCSVRSLLRRLN